ncbi:DUF2971 domain-containing protein [Pseudomonas sp. DWP2-2]|uniref:DUF2971 domain-containing protein n=1 Tax=Pseudomonas sp. DWP2-2 TaxID=2804609 RepID=UPI003CE70EBB
MSLLYHYTSQHGLLGILGSQAVWATNTHFLNDPTEFVHALALAQPMASRAYDDDYSQFFGAALYHSLDHMHGEDLYVSSFSEKPDLLSQWRGYCPGGSGYCIGFDQALIAEYCEERGIRLEKCLYEYADQLGAVASIISAAKDFFPSIPYSEEQFYSLPIDEKLDAMDELRRKLEHELKSDGDRVIEKACELLSGLASLFKHQGFHEEAEWRIIASKPEQEVCFRPGPSYVIPFISLDLLKTKPHALKRVIVGPNPNQPRAEKAAQILLERYGYSADIVTSSAIPFNNW